MNQNELHLLANYQSLMKPEERMIARWIIEEWDQVSMDIPKWLHARIWNLYPEKYLKNPDFLGREICIRLLSSHRSQMHLPRSHD